MATELLRDPRRRTNNYDCQRNRTRKFGEKTEEEGATLEPTTFMVLVFSVGYYMTQTLRDVGCNVANVVAVRYYALRQVGNG